MTLRRGAVSACLAAFATAFAHVALVDGCGEFSVADGPNDAAPPVDAMNSGFDGAAGDADASGDAGKVAAPDAACGTHFFCADFEDARPDAGWAELDLGGGGTAAIAVDAGAPGNALRSTIPGTVAQAGAWAYVVEPFAGVNGLHVELEINAPVANFPPTGEVTILEVSGEVAMKQSGVGVVLRSGVPSLGFYIPKGDGSSITPVALMDMPRGQWVHLALDFRFGSGGSVKLVVDQSTVLDMPVGTAMPAMTQLRVGVQHYNGATPAFSALFDTVRVDLLN